MAYDEALANRLRELLRHEPGLTEKKMFGGLGFMIGGNMAVAAGSGGGLMIHVDPQTSEGLVDGTTVAPMQMRGRTMTGWLLAAPQAWQSDAELARLVAVGADYARSLPPK